MIVTLLDLLLLRYFIHCKMLAKQKYKHTKTHKELQHLDTENQNAKKYVVRPILGLRPPKRVTSSDIYFIKRLQICIFNVAIISFYQSSLFHQDITNPTSMLLSFLSINLAGSPFGSISELLLTVIQS